MEVILNNNMRIVRTADICDRNSEDVRVCELQFKNYGARNHFHGVVETFSTFESNSEMLGLLAEGGTGKVLVVDGRGSFRRALCGGNIALEAYKFGWEGLIFNGVIRDSHEILDLDFGVKALGATALPPKNETIGVTGLKLSFGNIIFRPGDYLYADQDCVVVLDNQDHESA